MAVVAHRHTYGDPQACDHHRDRPRHAGRTRRTLSHTRLLPAPHRRRQVLQPVRTAVPGGLGDGQQLRSSRSISRPLTIWPQHCRGSRRRKHPGHLSHQVRQQRGPGLIGYRGSSGCRALAVSHVTHHDRGSRTSMRSPDPRKHPTVTNYSCHSCPKTRGGPVLDTRTGLDAGQVIRWKFLAPLDRDLPARLHLPRRHPATQRNARHRPWLPYVYNVTFLTKLHRVTHKVHEDPGSYAKVDPR